MGHMCGTEEGPQPSGEFDGTCADKGKKTDHTYVCAKEETKLLSSQTA